MTVRKCIFLALVASLILFLVACAVGGGPQTIAKEAFEQWAEEAGIPYEDVRYETLSDDGTFATVRVTAFFRESAEAGWREMQADVECRKLAGEWRCDEHLSFTLSEAEQERILAAQNATATVMMAAQNATATTIMATHIAAQATATADYERMVRVTETAWAVATATAQSAIATQTAATIEQQAGPIYHEALSAYESQDWWLAYYYLQQVARIDASYRDTELLLQEIETEHPQGHILVADGGNIYLMDAWGKQTQQIETGRVASLSPSGQKIAFVRGNYLRVGALEGDHPSVFEFDLNVEQRPFVVWSPDEHSLLIPVDVPQHGCKRGVVLFNIDNNQLEEIIPADSRYGGEHCSIVGWATWNPTGNRIAFAAGWNPVGWYGRGFQGGAIVWVIDLESGTAIEIGRAYGSSFSWSPDGQLIAFVGGYGSLYTMSPDGSNAQLVVDEDGLEIIDNVIHVTWSADGKSLLCVRDAGTWTDELWVVDPDGSSAIQIAEYQIVEAPPSWGE